MAVKEDVSKMNDQLIERNEGKILGLQSIHACTLLEERKKYISNSKDFDVNMLC
jgi:hypothetical protein